MADIQVCSSLPDGWRRQLVRGELSGLQRAELLAHMSECTVCMAYVKRAAPELIWAMATESLPAPAPIDAAAFAARLPERLPNVPFPQSQFSWLRIAATLMLLVAAGAMLYRHRTPGPVESMSTSMSAAEVAVQLEPDFTPNAPVQAVESGAEAFQVQEFEASGFDGQPVLWIRLQPEAVDASAGASGSPEVSL